MGTRNHCMLLNVLVANKFSLSLSTSNPFDILIGLRPGCTLSPYIFNLYIDDIKRIIGYCINTTFYDRGHVSDTLPSLRGNALPRHEREFFK